MNTHEYYVSLEIAKMLKEAGFDWNCYELYERWYERDGRTRAVTSANWNTSSKYYSAPTLEVAQRWLREVKGMCLTIQPLLDKVNGQCNVIVGFTPFIHRMDGEMIIVPLNSEHTYEKALEAGEQKALQICLEQDKKSE